jgi:hypothetical protein
MKQNLEKVIKFEPLIDKDGQFIPYCDFQFHRGILKDNRKCERNNCRYYRKLYLEDDI